MGEDVAPGTHQGEGQEGEGEDGVEDPGGNQLSEAESAGDCGGGHVQVHCVARYTGAGGQL